MHTVWESIEASYSMHKQVQTGKGYSMRTECLCYFDLR